MSNQNGLEVDEVAFHTDVQYMESLWQRRAIGAIDLPVIDKGQGEPLVFVPILEHLEFVYAQQIRKLSEMRRVIMYRRYESRTRPMELTERVEELCSVLDSLKLEATDFIAHGDAAMVLLEFAARYPQRCRSLIIVAQAADYQIEPHPFIWLLHELFLRLPVEYFLPAWFLRRTVVNYLVARSENASNAIAPKRLPRHLIDKQFRKIALWPFVYKFSVLPIIHNFDIRERLDRLTMPVLVINRADDALSPEAKTRWLAERLPNCAGYTVVPGGERFFMYSEAETVNHLIETFLVREDEAMRS